MFVASSGRGWLVGVVTAGCLLLSDFLTSLHYHDASYYSQHGWPKLAAFWVAAGIVQWLLPRKEDEVLPGTQRLPAKKSRLGGRDSLFLVPVKYWGVILFSLGIGFYYVRG
jgi:hypothetical protein